MLTVSPAFSRVRTDLPVTAFVGPGVLLPLDDTVLDVFAAAPGASITVLPDGSVDHRYRVLGPDSQTLSRGAFAKHLIEGAETFLLEAISTEPGGMAVNAACQVDALGADARLLGHLDHDVFDELPFQTVSMGAPADVRIYEFEEHAVMLTDRSRALQIWTFQDLQDALEDRSSDWLEADAIICSNWASVPKMTDVLEDIAASDLENGWFVIDPGDVSVRPESDIDEFLDVLGDLEQSFDVVLNANDAEIATIGEVRGVDAALLSELLAEIRADAGITAAMVHAAPEAAVATTEGIVRVPNYSTRVSVYSTGGGDRFTGGLAVALASGANWAVALQLANACATHFVASGETPTADLLREFLAISPGSDHNTLE